MNKEAMIAAATALCAMVGVKPQMMVVVNGAVIIQTSQRDYYELAHRYDGWEFRLALAVSVREMNALAAAGALNDLLPAGQQTKAIEEKSEGKWWNRW